jgi:hypothetical protein
MQIYKVYFRHGLNAYLYDCYSHLGILDIGYETEMNEGRNSVLEIVQPSDQNLPLHRKVEDNLPENFEIKKSVNMTLAHNLRQQ